MATRNIAAAMGSTLILMGAAGTAAAQDAAESAIILGGAGPSQAGTQRSLGSAIANSLNGAANTVAATSPRTDQMHSSRTLVIPFSRDPLAGTNVPTYRLTNGASIRVSGRLTPTQNVACVKDCR